MEIIDRVTIGVKGPNLKLYNIISYGNQENQQMPV